MEEESEIINALLSGASIDTLLAMGRERVRRRNESYAALGWPVTSVLFPSGFRGLAHSLGLPYREGRSASPRQTVRSGIAPAGASRPKDEASEAPAPRPAPRSTRPATPTPSRSQEERNRLTRYSIAADLARLGLPTSAPRKPAPPPPAKLARPSFSPEAERFDAAVHEASHLVLALACQAMVYSASCNAGGGGSCEHAPAKTKLDTGAILLAGGIGMQLFLGEAGPCWSKTDLELFERECAGVSFDDAVDRAREILTANAGPCERIARRLAERGYLTGPEILEAAGNVVRFD